MASKSAALCKLHSFLKPLHPPLSGLLHVKIIGVRKVAPPLAFLKQCTVSLIFDMFALKFARTIMLYYFVEKNYFM